MSASLRPAAETVASPPAWLTLLIAASCGLAVANIYYVQPIAGPVAAALGLPPHAAGLIVTMTQLGYVAGLLFVVPLGDLLENRALIATLAAAAAAAMAAAFVAASAPAGAAAAFLVAMLLVGAASTVVQVLVPYAAHLAPEALRGRVVGRVMSGLMLGIMLSRPVASFVTAALSWRAVFAAAACATALLAVLLRAALPRRRPAPGLGYGALLASMAGLLLRTPVLQRRALYHACLFGAFSLFWTVSPLLLAREFHFSQSGIALFALAGAAGAVAAPVAGWAGDRGWTRPATGLAMLAAAAAFLLSRLDADGSALSLGLLVAAAIVLDFGVTANLVLGQRAIYALGAEQRSRLNGLYMATFFVGGAAGSAAGGWAFAQGGWPLAAWIGAALPAVALLAFSTEFLERR